MADEKDHPYGLGKDEIRRQMMPAPDEAPLTMCPWCGEEYNVKEQDSDQFYDPVDPERDVYRHRSCGKLVRFVGLDNFEEENERP